MDEMDAARAAKRARKDEPIADDDDDEDQPEISSSESEDSDEGEDSEEDSPGGDDAMDEGYGDEGNDECMTDENALDEREGGGTGEWIYPGRRTEDGAMEPEQQHQAASSDQDDSGVMRLFSRSGVVGHIAKDHPDLLAESNTLAAVSPPPLCADLEVRIPRSVVNEGRISSPQLEPIAYFARSVGLSSLSSGGARSGGGGGGVGFFLSDGTGCGKGRVIAGTIIHLCNSGFLRHLWLSTSSDLIQDATRDIRDIKGKVAVVPLKEINASVDLDPQTAKKHFRQHGWRPGQPVVLFSSYSLLVQGGKGPNKASRVEQLIRWLSGPAESRSSSSSAQTQNSRVRSGGLIVFDEAHKAKNFKAADGPTSGQSQTGQAVYQLQVQCVHCPVLYSSATGASDIQHMAYMERLGLWGPGKAFPDFQTFKGKMSKGGVAALECVSLELKSQGKYVCRQLSFADVQFSVTQVEPSQELTDRYTQFAELFADIHRLHVQLLTRKRVDWGKTVNEKKAAMKKSATQVSATAQRFFGQLCVAAKVPTAVSMAKEALENDMSVVICLWSTGEARSADEMKDRDNKQTEQLLSSMHLSVKHLLDNHFPTCDKRGKPIEDLQQSLSELKARVARFEQDKLFPRNVLDSLIDELGGPPKAAELSGRQKRLERRGTKFEYVERNTGLEAVPADRVNLTEQAYFQTNRKRVAIITEAASAGISLHAEKGRSGSSAPKKRLMIPIEVFWSAEKALQQLGRCHRSNQLHPPIIHFLVTPFGGERRFISTVARRVKSMGAITTGDSRAGGVGAKSEDLLSYDVYSTHGYQAVVDINRYLNGENVGVPFLAGGGNREAKETFIEEARSALDGVGMIERIFNEKKDDKLMDAFLNKLMMLRPSLQQHIFDLFTMIHDARVELSRVNGEHDQGVKSIGRRDRTSVAHTEVIYTDPTTGMATQYFCLRVDHGVPWQEAIQIHDARTHSGSASAAAAASAVEGFYRTTNNQQQQQQTYALAIERKTALTSRGELWYQLLFPDRPMAKTQTDGATPINRVALSSSGYVRVADMAEAERGWTEQYDSSADDTQTRVGQRCSSGSRRFEYVHLLSGNVLSLWSMIEAAARAQQADQTSTTTTSSSADDNSAARLRVVRAHVSGHSGHSSTTTVVLGVRIESEMQVEVIRMALQACSNTPQNNSGQVVVRWADVMNNRPVITAATETVVALFKRPDGSTDFDKVLSTSALHHSLSSMAPHGPTYFPTDIHGCWTALRFLEMLCRRKTISTAPPPQQPPAAATAAAAALSHSNTTTTRGAERQWRIHPDIDKPKAEPQRPHNQQQQQGGVGGRGRGRPILSCRGTTAGNNNKKK